MPFHGAAWNPLTLLRPLVLILPKTIPTNQLTQKKTTQSSFHLYHARSSSPSQEAQLGSQDELEGNHLRDLSVFLFCQGHYLQWCHKGKTEDIHWVETLHKLFPS